MMGLALLDPSYALLFDGYRFAQPTLRVNFLGTIGGQCGRFQAASPGTVVSSLAILECNGKTTLIHTIIQTYFDLEIPNGRDLKYGKVSN